MGMYSEIRHETNSMFMTNLESKLEAVKNLQDENSRINHIL